MKLNNLSRLKDNRTNCYSLLFEMSIQDYLTLIKKIDQNNDRGLEGQREPLKTSSAMRIRKQMVKDIKAGTVLPPIVLGFIIAEEKFNLIPKMSNDEFKDLIEGGQGDLTIIDGIQRTTAIIEAFDNTTSAQTQTIVRVEFWVSIKLNSLIYRMLVLNTGQVPWNLRRQVETVFSTMIDEISRAVPEMKIYTVNESKRRTDGGQYQANDLIELYLAFGGRKEKVDTKERLADEFTRLDFIEATENENFSDTFYRALQTMTSLDIEFSRYKVDDKGEKDRFNSGMSLLKSQTARVGLITSIAKKIYGRPGIERSNDQISDNIEIVNQATSLLIERLKKMENNEIGQFLALEMLNEKLQKKSTKIGDFEREFFTKSFETLLEEAEKIKNMEVCWLSY